jgi:hypothetical protein
MTVKIDTQSQQRHKDSVDGPTARRPELGTLRTTPTDALNIEWKTFRVQGDRPNAIAELFKSDRFDQKQQLAWVERNSRPHPRDPSIPKNAPSVRDLIYESRLSALMDERAQSRVERSFAD